MLWSCDGEEAPIGFRFKSESRLSIFLSVW